MAIVQQVEERPVLHVVEAIVDMEAITIMIIIDHHIRHHPIRHQEVITLEVEVQSHDGLDQVLQFITLLQRLQRSRPSGKQLRS
jgi:hypothetical protein